MKLSKPVALFALPIILFFACGRASDKVSKNLLLEPTPSPEKLEDNKIGVADTAVIANDYQSTNPEEHQNEQNQKTLPQKIAQAEKIDWDKKIIKTANLNIEVKDYNAFNNQLHQIVKHFGGYVSQEEQNQSAYQVENKVSIKIPVNQFEDAVTRLTSNSEKIIERKITSEDVTTEMIDTKSRIEAKKEVRLRYLDLLKQAKNMKDILEVQNEINGIQEELESAAGRVAYLNHSSAFSTINLTFYQVTDVTAANEKEPTYLHKMSEAFSGGLKWISDLILGLVTLWPLMIPVVALFVIYKRRKASKPRMTNS